MTDIDLRFVERTVIVEKAMPPALFDTVKFVRVLQWRKTIDMGPDSWGQHWDAWVDVPLVVDE